MSRIGNKIINIPAGTEILLDNNLLTVKTSKGQLQRQFSHLVDINIEGSQIKVSRHNDEIFSRQIHGTTRALIQNMITGLNEQFTKKLEIVGVGYRAQLQQNKLILSLGFSHQVEVLIPEGLVVDVPKNTQISITGIDKEKVGKFAAEVRQLKKPEPYKGKGIRYEGEHVRQKAGKTAK